MAKNKSRVTVFYQANRHFRGLFKARLLIAVPEIHYNEIFGFSTRPMDSLVKRFRQREVQYVFQTAIRAELEFRRSSEIGYPYDVERLVVEEIVNAGYLPRRKGWLSFHVNEIYYNDVLRFIFPGLWRPQRYL